MLKTHLLPDRELHRYARHIAIPQFGISAQKKLKKSKILVIGAGGLGSPILFYLAAAGVGQIGIVDFDTIDESNLQRQILFNTADIGKPKAQTAKIKLEALNPYIKIKTHNTQLSTENARQLIRQYDVIADGTDNFPTRYLINDACVLEGKPYVHGSIFQFEGQVAVFNFLLKDGTRSPNYRDIFPTPPAPELVPNCAEGGVLGVLPGIIGSMQASEIIKVITGVGEPLVGKIAIFDAAYFTTRVLKITKNPNLIIDRLIDYEQFCGITPSTVTNIKEIAVRELHQMMSFNQDFQLIDVRAPYEYRIVNIGGESIPLGELTSSVQKISKNKKVIVLCKTGNRSAKAIQELEKKWGYKNLYNLKGGILAWINEIAPDLPNY